MRQKIVGAVFRVLLFLGLVDYINYPDWTWVETDGILHKEYSLEVSWRGERKYKDLRRR